MTLRDARHPAPLAGMALGCALVAAITAALVPVRGDVTRATPALALMTAVVAAGMVGGTRPALVTALAAALAFNVAFIPPFWTLHVDVIDDVVALVAFVTVAGAVGTLVAREADRRWSAEQKAAELQALHDRYLAVEAERQELAQEATRAAVLEEVDRQRAALLRSVSHDLRTPLSTIRAVTSDLRDGAAYDPATREELLDLVVDEAERLDRLVGNLLSLSRIEAGALDPRRQPVPLDELVADTVKRLGRLLRRVRVDLDLPADLPLVDADYSQIDQVVTNLVENAVRHAPPDSTIRIGCRSEPAGTVRVSVADEGPGVAAADVGHVFEPFWSGNGGTSSGVGLSICRAIVEAHGGEIGVTPAPASGRGARFEFTLPVRRD